MRKHTLLTIILFLVCTIPSWAAQRVTCYTMWDEWFLYAAFDVQDTDVQSTNTTHMSEPWLDDAVEVYLETDLKQAPKWTANSYGMSVSSGGGSSFLVEANSAPAAKKIYSFKYAAKVQGSPNDQRDRDLGYTIEMALPWSEMGGPPVPGTVMGFNVICRIKGENEGFVSFSPMVKAADDISSPGKWGKIKLTDTPTIIAIENGAVVCRKVLTKSPVVDGNISPNEWIRDMNFTVMKPDPSPVAAARQRLSIEKLAMAAYYEYFAVDPAQDPAAHLGSSGISSITDVRLVQRHKEQLAAMRSTGVDIVLPVQGAQGGSVDLPPFVQALKELKAADVSYPLVGLQLSAEDITSDPANADPEKAALALSNRISGFYRQVPDEFLAAVQLPQEKDGRPAYVVTVTNMSPELAPILARAMQLCNEWFSKSTVDRRLIWIGESAYAKSVTMDGYMPSSQYVGFDAAGWISVATISPGREPGLARLDADSFKLKWDEVISKSPDFLIIDSWNNYSNGSWVAPSPASTDTKAVKDKKKAASLNAEMASNRYADITKMNLIRFNGMKPHNAKYLKHTTPDIMLPGTLYQITLTIKNAGTKPWYPKDGIFLAGRWYKDGALFADSNVRLPMQEKGLALEVIEKTVGIRTIDQEGTPLPEGDYELRWEMVGKRDKWFTDSGDMPLVVPVKIGTPAPGFRVLGSTLPSVVQGAVQSAVIRVRNDGPVAWKAGAAKLGIRVVLPVALPDTDAITDAVVFAADVEPGRVAQVAARINLPQNVSEAEIRWYVYDGEKWLSSVAPVADEHISIR